MRLNSGDLNRGDLIYLRRTPDTGPAAYVGRAYVVGVATRFDAGYIETIDPWNRTDMPARSRGSGMRVSLSSMERVVRIKKGAR